MNTEEPKSKDEDSCAHSNETKASKAKRDRGQRKPRDITVETYTNKMYDDESPKNILPSGSREVTPSEESKIPETKDDEVNVFSGNPFVEITKAIIHLYKRNERTAISDQMSKTLCLLAVPATLNCHDLLNFVAPCHATLKHIRIIRDGTPNQFMVLLEFRSVEAAIEFYDTYNGAPYNSLEPDSLCHAVWVSNVEWSHEASVPVGHTELPTCPVCLERMDESVDGVLTVLCNHAFHANCLIKWGDATCPVCRYVQTPEMTENSVCMECEGTEALWICLICGHVGCGRYQGGHAASHFRSTNHTYALQLGTNRVWDYAGDNFVHRLLQNKSDGKLVATQVPGGDGDEKIDSIQLEFTYLLTSQLDTQRKYYEERLNKIESMLETEQQLNTTRNESLVTKCSELETQLQTVTKEKGSLEKKLSHMHAKLTTLLKELSDERQMSKALQSNQATWQAKYEKFESEKLTEISELKEQIRDLMFYMEAQNQISNSDLNQEDINGTSVTLDESPAQTSKNRRNRKKK